MNELVNTIGNGFFPVAMCAVLMWYVTQKDAQHAKEIEALKDQMNANNANFVAALESVRQAITDLREALLRRDNG